MPGQPEPREPRFLLEIGRADLASFVEWIQQRFPGPRAGLPARTLSDQLFFCRVEQLLKSLGFNLWQSAQQNRPDAPAQCSEPSKPSGYCLARGLGVWELMFEGHSATVRHEKGILYVAWLLTHPGSEPIHALDLIGRIPELYRQQTGLLAMPDPLTGKSAALASHARIQERSLAAEDLGAFRKLLRKEKELEAILNDEDATEPVKAEVQRELETLVEFRRLHQPRATDNAQRAAHSVRKAIRRFYKHLLAAKEPQDRPHPVLRSFAEHLKKYLLAPSTGYGGRQGRTGQGAGFTYQPPPGVVWTTGSQVPP